jgi:MFS transporter, PAT family, beta-lactamase induction signal transducer AmpG
MKNNEHLATRKKVWSFVPSIYFIEGLPYVLINIVSVIFYKRMGIGNDQIAFWTSWLYLPWVLKMFWSPFVDIFSTKRNWILVMQILMGTCMALIALTLHLESFLFPSLVFFILGAFISATQDIAIDGFYMLALRKEDQAFFVGIRSLFYRVAMIFGTGGLVVFAGQLEEKTGNIPFSWTMIFLLVSVIFFLGFIYHKFILPKPEDYLKEKAPIEADKRSFKEVFKTYFTQKGIFAILAFILFYRLGEAMLVKIASLFMLDPRTSGGMGLSTTQVGVVYGTVGMLCLVFGGIFGGWLISRYGFKKCLWPMVIALNLPDLAYVYMAYAQPSVAMTYPLVGIEQLGYGVGFTAFMVYLMYIVDERFKTSHYAISTGIMALGMMVPGMISGKLQMALGYKMFFVVVLILTVPGMLSLFFIPRNEKMN